MDPFEVVVQGELFRITERIQPDGGASYDFAWLNGPADGTYGFTVAPSSGQLAATELVTQAGQFVEAFYGSGGIGETDFPGHAPAKARSNDVGQP
ncbi:hypothetical protein [Microbacterium sp.]|uniref:hypothetical protein n=1 Tax=Microbacterium sp. TaxID=51671 RepID=UPI002811DBB8|nr:hypothetical protein [Microbacterium sp.]